MRKAFDRVLAWLLVLGQLSWAMPVEAAPRQVEAGSRPTAVASQDPAPQIKPNRRPPSVKPVPQTPVFSAWPKDEEILRARVFAEPLVPIGASTPEENAALARALTAYQRRGGGERNEDLVAFLEGHQVSPWRASLQLSLGTVYRRTGYFTRALVAWEEAWGIAKSATSPHGRAVADRAAGELAQLHARLGNQQRLEQLFNEVEGRDIGGAAGELIAGAKRGLWLMQNQPERAFRCGPLAIDRILASVKPSYRGDVRLHTYPSTSRGTTLLEMRTLAGEFELGLQAAHREDRPSEVLVPALVHWKAGHFAALVKEENGRYLIQDATFGEELWVSRRALDDETSGYMLVPEGPLPEGWRSVPDAEAETVRGKGATNESKIQNQKPCDHQSGGSGGCGGFCPKGLAVYSFHTMLVNLHITDTPVGYSPPRGPAVNFSLTYNQREAFQPQVFSYGNVGPKWNYAWQSYIEDDPTTPSQPVDLYVRGGGQESYTGYNASTQSYGRHTENRALVVRVTSDPVRYERRTGDGSVDVYGQPDGALTFPRKVFLTRSIDPQGNAVSFTYDASLRLAAVTDAIGQVTTLSYELPGDALKLTKVTDPFGRFATLAYDPTGRLSSITDVIGMVSAFEYGPSDFIKTMTTPYGTTAFSAFDEGRRRWLEATDPLGGTERLEYVNSIGDALVGEEANAIPYGLASNEYPTGGFYPGPATNYVYRNTFFWSKLAMARAPGKYTAAKLIHWLHTDGLTQTGGVIENEKEPMESMRTFYQYPDMAWQGTGSYAQPSAVGRVVEDGSSQISRYEYNARGKKTKEIDPLGRETVNVYGTNNVPDANPTTGDGVDLLQIKQKNGSGYDLLWSATYNAQHLPLTVTDAAGQTTTYTYNATGQLLTETTPPRAGITENRTTTYVYDTNGYLQSITEPATGATTSYTYDGYGRVRTVTDSDNYTLTDDYDALDRVTKVTYPDTTFEETVYNRLDAEKRRDRRGRWTQTFFDALRRPVAVKDAVGQTSQYQYGGSGCSSCGSGGDKLTKLVDPNGNAISWEYDVQGRLTREARADGSDAVVTYEATSSRVKQIRDRKQQLIDIQYFLDNNWKQVSHSNTTQPTPTVSFTHDPVYNRLATITDGTGTTSYSYYPVTPPPSLGAGRLQAVDGPFANDVISYSYDELGRVAGRSINGVGLSLTYDALGRLSGETNALGSFSYGHDGVSGRVTTSSSPSGQSTTYSYFGSGGDHRLQQILNQRSGGATLSSFQYAYDLNGLITSWTQQTDSNLAKAYGIERDAVDRLLAATLQTTDPTPAILKRHRYTYDPAGNRTTEQIYDAAVAAAHNNLNALTALQPGGALSFRGTVNEPAAMTVQSKPGTVDASNAFQAQAQVGAGATNVVVAATDPSGNTRTNTYQVSLSGSASTLSYDTNGNLTSDGVRTFEWDGANRLTAVNQGANRSEFTYDGWSHRVRIVEKDNAVVTSDRRFLWCGSTLCEERDAAGSTVTRRFFEQGTEEGGAAFFYATDHLGNVRDLTDATGAVRARYDYDPYGRATKLSGDKDSVFTFAGLVNHAPSGLLLANYRAYDPSSGRWISQDPIGLEGGMNLYGYVHASPMDDADPLGLFVPAAAVAAAAMGGAQGGAVLGPAGMAAGAIIAGGALALTYWWTHDDSPSTEPQPQPAPPPTDPQGGAGGGGSSSATTTTPTTTTTTSTAPQPVSSPGPSPQPSPSPTCPPEDPCKNIRKECEQTCRIVAASKHQQARQRAFDECMEKCVRLRGLKWGCK